MKTGKIGKKSDMNKHSIILLAALLAISGCTVKPDNDVNITDDIDLVITAYQEGYTDTKTTLIDGGTQVYWESNDEVKVFYKTTGSRFTSTNTEPAGKADFTGNLTITGFFNEGFTADTPLWAVYPYRSDATSDGESVTTTLPAEQTGRAGSFAKNTFITLATSTKTQMGFYNVTGGVRFSLTHEGVNEVIFEGQNGEDIAGKVKLVFADGVPAVQEVIEGQKSITLTAPSGGTFQTGQWYYIVALPGTLSNGFKMTFSTETQYATLKSSGSKTIKRGVFGSLADADDDLIYKDKGDEPTPTDVIEFADLVAKYACVEKFDTNGDGEVSYAEAAAATTLSGLFTDWYTMTRFDEIKYFTGVTSTEGVFKGLTKLESITIPDNITKLGTFQGCSSLKTVILPEALGSIPTNCFDGCTALTDVTLPTCITAIPDYCFQNCVALETLAIPSTITAINQYAFYGCSALGGLDLPSGLKTIGNNAFQNCKALASPDFPSTLTSIGNSAFSGCSGITAISLGEGVSIGTNAFSGCSSLVSVILPSNLSAIPAYCFQNCTVLSSVTWPESLSSIGNYAFYGCDFKGNDYTLQLPSTVNTIGSKAFSTLHHLIVPSSSFVSIASDSFELSFGFLYVPNVMVELYKDRTNWRNYSSIIRPIEDYPAELSALAVDLGLSVKWAPFNIGALSAQAYGAYFTWGETEPKSAYSWSTYKWCNGASAKLTKYCTSTSYWDCSGSPDGKTVLDLEDDAARANWGGSWRMPTDAEWTELRNNCTWTWTNNYNGTGIAGQIVTSNKPGYTGMSIFLPAAGYRDDTKLGGVGSYGCYWSSSLYTVDSRGAMLGVNFSSSYINGSSSFRCYGRSVRPVTK